MPISNALLPIVVQTCSADQHFRCRISHEGRQYVRISPRPFTRGGKCHLPAAASLTRGGRASRISCRIFLKGRQKGTICPWVYFSIHHPFSLVNPFFYKIFTFLTINDFSLHFSHHRSTAQKQRGTLCEYMHGILGSARTVFRQNRHVKNAKEQLPNENCSSFNEFRFFPSPNAKFHVRKTGVLRPSQVAFRHFPCP